MDRTIKEPACRHRAIGGVMLSGRCLRRPEDEGGPGAPPRLSRSRLRPRSSPGRRKLPTACTGGGPRVTLHLRGSARRLRATRAESPRVRRSPSPRIGRLKGGRIDDLVLGEVPRDRRTQEPQRRVVSPSGAPLHILPIGWMAGGRVKKPVKDADTCGAREKGR